jgi:hypothetical protein
MGLLHTHTHTHTHKPEVDAHLDVLFILRLLHRQVSSGETHAEDLIQLEIDCSFCLIYLGIQRLMVGDQDRELVCNAIKRA